MESLIVLTELPLVVVDKFRINNFETVAFRKKISLLLFTLHPVSGSVLETKNAISLSLLYITNLSEFKVVKYLQTVSAPSQCFLTSLNPCD